MTINIRHNKQSWTSGGETVWPDATNTGPRFSLTNSGSINSSSNGQVIERLRISGGTIIVTHSNVIVRDCEIINNSFCIELNGGSGNVIEYCSLHSNGTGNAGSYGIGAWTGQGAIMRRNNIYQFENGIFFAGDDKQFLFNYIHTPTSNSGDPHYDGIQSTGAGGVNNAWFEGNHIILKDTSCIIMQNEDNGYSGTVTITGNKLLGVPNVAAPIYARGDKPSGTLWAANLVVTNNIIDGNAYGYNLDNTQGPGSGFPGTGTLTWTGNVNLAGTPVDP